MSQRHSTTKNAIALGLVGTAAVGGMVSFALRMQMPGADRTAALSIEASSRPRSPHGRC